MAEDIVFMVLVGAGGLLTITAVTYMGAYVVDRVCSSPYPTERIFSPISNKANLWGMGYQERMEVLDRLFTDKDLIHKYDKATGRVRNVTAGKKTIEIEMTGLSAKKTSAGTNEQVVTEYESDIAAPNSEIERGVTVGMDAPNLNPLDQISHSALSEQGMDSMQQTTLCSICLNEFGAYSCMDLLIFLAASQLILH